MTFGADDVRTIVILISPQCLLWRQYGRQHRSLPQPRAQFLIGQVRSTHIDARCGAPDSRRGRNCGLVAASDKLADDGAAQKTAAPVTKAFMPFALPPPGQTLSKYWRYGECPPETTGEKARFGFPVGLAERPT